MTNDDVIFNKIDFIFILLIAFILMFKLSNYILAFLIIFLFCRYLKLGCLPCTIVSLVSTIIINW